jgi:hypothetical protein
VNPDRKVAVADPTVTLQLRQDRLVGPIDLHLQVPANYPAYRVILLHQGI